MVELLVVVGFGVTCCAIVAVDIMGSQTAAKTLPATRRQHERPFALINRDS